MARHIIIVYANDIPEFEGNVNRLLDGGHEIVAIGYQMPAWYAILLEPFTPPPPAEKPAEEKVEPFKESKI